jgi:hypothetical protein
VTAVNLRSDLARLSDTDLAARLEEAWHEYDAAGKPARWLQWAILSPLHSWRGPIRHPRAYRFLSVLGGADGPWWLVLLLATVISDKRVEEVFRAGGPPDAHLTLCEILDIVDEVERRVARRQAKAS